jgi:hypothetical protein
LIDHLCTDLGRETPGTENFRINIDHEISEAETRASNSDAIPFGETPEQRKRQFQEALRKILRVAQDRNSSNKKVWTEALRLLDNPRFRVPNHKRPKNSPKRYRTARASSSKSGGRRPSGGTISTITAKDEDWQHEKPGEPLGVFLAASLDV